MAQGENSPVCGCRRQSMMCRTFLEPDSKEMKSMRKIAGANGNLHEISGVEIPGQELTETGW